MQIILQENEDFPLMPSYKLPFWLVFKETTILLLLLVYRLLLLRYVLVVSHKFRND